MSSSSIRRPARSSDLGDLTEACGEKGKKAIVQGKSHVNFVECAGQALLRHARRLLLDRRWHGNDGHPSPGLQALSRRPPAGLDWRRGKFEDLAIAPARRHPLHEHGHGARADLRPDLADRALLPLRPGHARPEGLRPGLRAGRKRHGPELSHHLPFDRRRPRRRLGLLHRLRRRHPPLPASSATPSRSSRGTT